MRGRPRFGSSRLWFNRCRCARGGGGGRGVIPDGVTVVPSAGGVMPSMLEPTGRRLSFAEREEIACLRATGSGVREIARHLHRDPSTISRELGRLSLSSPGQPYRASTAQADADVKAKRPKPAKLATNLVLRRHVQAKLELNHSPEQISRRLRQDFPDDPEMRVSHETIYTSIYVQGRGALRKDLAGHLRTGRVRRRAPGREAAAGRTRGCSTSANARRGRGPRRARSLGR